MNSGQILTAAVSVMGILWTAGMAITGWLFKQTIQNKADIQALRFEKCTYEQATKDHGQIGDQIRKLAEAITNLELRISKMNIEAEHLNMQKLQVLQETQKRLDAMTVSISELQLEVYNRPGRPTRQRK